MTARNPKAVIKLTTPAETHTGEKTAYLRYDATYAEFGGWSIHIDTGYPDSWLVSTLLHLEDTTRRGRGVIPDGIALDGGRDSVLNMHDLLEEATMHLFRLAIAGYKSPRPRR